MLTYVPADIVNFLLLGIEFHLAQTNLLSQQDQPYSYRVKYASCNFYETSSQR